MSLLVQNLVGWAALAAVPVTALAYPPAPHFTVSGIIRDQFGDTLDVEGAEVRMFANGVKVAESGVRSYLYPDRNYQLKVPVDSGITARLYARDATSPQAPFTIEVVIDGVAFLPIEFVPGAKSVGEAAENVSLDLSLGEDADGDGLPDLWEQWQLFESGLLPGDPRFSLATLDGDGDFDGDGLSNRGEYVVGTYAFDAGEALTLEFEAIGGDGVVSMEFLAVYGKVYTLERSRDGAAWEAVPLRFVDAGEPGAAYWVADRIERVRVFDQTASGEGSWQYRLQSR